MPKISLLRVFALKAIAFYQRFLSVLKPRCCRFYPSCSEFARQSFAKNGFFRALGASFFRILRCNPYFKGGFDYPKMPKSRLKFEKWRAGGALRGLKFLYVPCDERSLYIVKIVFKGKESE